MSLKLKHRAQSAKHKSAIPVADSGVCPWGSGGGGYLILGLWKTMENWLRYCYKDLVSECRKVHERISVADPGFPRWGRERQTLSLEKKPIIWPDLYQKLHEHENNWTERGWRPWWPPSRPHTPLDPPMDSSSCFKLGVGNLDKI